MELVREGTRSRGGALYRERTREAARSRARWRAREAAAPGGGPVRALDAGRPVKFLGARAKAPPIDLKNNKLALKVPPEF